MGQHDRDYMKYGNHGGPSLPSRPSHFLNAPVSKALFISNIAVFFLGVLLTQKGELGPFFLWGHFSVQTTIFDLQLWRLLTFQFLHGDIMHLVMNMFGIFCFAPHVERWMGSRPFIVYYLLCGIAGGIFFTLLYFTPGLFEDYPSWIPMVGASAGIFGILAAFYKIAPNARILFLFFIPMQMKTFALIYGTYEIFNVLTEGHNAGGSAGHLGGAIFGLLFLRSTLMRALVIKTSSLGGKWKRKPKTRDAKIIREKTSTPIDVTDEVNRILEKITAKGMHSLTPKEREILDKARKK